MEGGNFQELIENFRLFMCNSLFVIFICIEGSCCIHYDIDKCEEIHAGETILIPAEIKELEVLVAERVKFLEVYVE